MEFPFLTELMPPRARERESLKQELRVSERTGGTLV